MKTKEIVIPALMVTALAVGLAYWLNYENWVAIPEAQSLIANQLRDPASTQFRNGRLTKAGWLCGELNSKNGNGGYVGFKRFASGGRDGSYYIEGHGAIGERSHDQFIAVLDQKIKVLQANNELRRINPDIGPLSDNEQEEMANANVFNDKWVEMCE